METANTFRMPMDDNSLSSAEERDAELALGSSKEQSAEKRSIWRNRLGHLAVALMVLGVTLSTYFLLSEQENENFETAFAQFARTVGEAALDRQNDLKESINALSGAISVYAQTSNESWPFVAIPMFESFAHDYKAISSAEFVGINNVVLHKDRQRMVEYTTRYYKSWIHSGHLLAHGNLDNLNQDPEKYQPFVSMKTKNGSWVEDIERDVYYVRTTQSPPNAAYGPLVNWNMASTFNLNITETTVYLRNETLFSEVRPFKAMSPKEHRGFHTNDDADNPHTFVFQPIYKNVKDPTSEIVAVINSAIAWDASMLNLLPENVQGIVCVIKNSCRQEYTYEINGHDAIYLGEEDLHDPRYDYLEVSVDLTSHSHPEFRTTPNHCLYSMSIYPTRVFEDSYQSNAPATHAGVVAATFCLVALLFFIYDCVVKRRTKELVSDAARSNAVIESLFPHEFRDKVLEQNNTQEEVAGTSSGTWKNLNKTVVNLNTVVGGNKNKALGNSSSEQETQPTTSPLAESYPETTVLFADLAGFTAWSNGRRPAEVFELLETLYEAFDAIAKRRRVYKIETIGDCYVAVTGLPKPQDDHAIIMVKFARDCMNKMSSLTVQLVATLGAECLDLQLRVGLHSGQVVGGILKGDKSRFQLFGDAMNTASRMESNGMPGRIHASQETADRLICHGKSKWVEAREGKITAKGKGELQTYWVFPDEAYSKTTADDSSYASSGLVLFEQP